MICPNCGKQTPEEDAFCGKCGQVLAASPATLHEIVQTELQNQLGANYKDQKLVAIETAESIVERLEKWSKWFLVALGIPTAILLATLAIIGVSSYREGIQKIDSAVKSGEERIAVANQKANDAIKNIGEIEKVTNSARKAVESLDSIRSEQRSRLERSQSDIAKLESLIESLDGRVKREIAGLQQQGKSLEGRVESGENATKVNVAVRAEFATGKLDKTVAFLKAMGVTVDDPTNSAKVEAAYRDLAIRLLDDPVLQKRFLEEAKKVGLIK